MRYAMAVLLIGGLMQGCASTTDLEARQLAWDGSGPNPCLFGGVTPQAAAHCQSQRWHSTGTLMALNREALEGLPKDPRDRPCQVHVSRLEEALAAHPQLRHQPVYSCPLKNNPRGSCHVSLLVMDEEGRSHVLDNGAVLNPYHYSASVGSLEEFSAELGGVYWIGYIPDDAREIALARFGRE